MASKPSKRKIPGESMFKPLRKQRFSDQISELIQKKIIEDKLAIGTSLPSEMEMTAEFQVSRTVIREALRILEISGLVHIKKGPKGGIFVANGFHEPIKRSLNNLINSGDVTIEHLFEARLLIEPHIAQEATRQATTTDLKKFRKLFADAARHMDDPKHLKQNNLDFHLLLARASGNPALSIMLESVFELLVEQTMDFVDISLERHFLNIHKRIFQVLEKRNPAKVEKLIREDILDVRKKIKEFDIAIV
jgi:DNA-binding FadR family transcriptional regulator